MHRLSKMRGEYSSASPETIPALSNEERFICQLFPAPLTPP